MPESVGHSRAILLSAALGVLLGLATYLALDPGDALRWDNGAHNFPLTLEAHRQLRQGALPAWNPFEWSGAPLLADPQSQALYPPTFLAFWLTGDTPVGMMRLAYCAHVGLAAAGMALLGCSLGFSPGGALLAGTFFATNAILVWIGTGFVNMFATVAWLPWLVLAAHRGIVGRHPERWLAVGSVVAALAWLAGYPQYWLYSAILVVAFGGAIAARSEHPWRGLWLPAAMLGLGLMLAAPQVLPLVALWEDSQRSDPLPMKEFLSGELDPRVLLSFFVPTPDGPFANLIPAHMGILTVCLTILALVRPDPLRLAVAAFGLLGVWLAAGQAGGLAPLLYGIPGMNLFRAAGKFLLWTVVSLSVLAGFGLSDVVRERRRVDRIVLVAAVLIASLVMLAHDDSQPNLAGEHVQAVMATSSLLGAALFAALLFRPPGRPRMFRLTALDLVAWATVIGVNAAIFAVYAGDGDVLTARFRTAPTYLDGVLAPPSAVSAPWMAGDGWRTFWGAGPVSPMSQPLSGALGDYWRAEMSTGYSALIERAYSETLAFDVSGRALGPSLQQLLQRPNRVLDILSNRYLLVENRDLVREAATRASAGRRSFEWLDLDERTALIVNGRALPRVRSVSWVQPVETRADALRAVQLGTVQPANVALVEAGERPRDTPTGERGDCAIRRTDPSPGAIDLALRCLSPGGFVVLSERWDRGWHAIVGDREVPVERVYGLVLGIDLPKGIHTVRLRYRPPGFTTGVWISAAALALLVAASWLGRRRRHVKQSRESLPATT